MKNSKRVLRSELKKAGAQKDEAQELAQFASTLPPKGKLSRSQKQAMLSGILPHHKYVVPYRSGLLTGGAVAVILALLVPNIVYSQPNDGVFYDIKRGAETVRSVIQPGFEPSESSKTLEYREDHDGSRGRGRGGSDDTSDDNREKSSSGSGSNDNESDDDSSSSSSDDSSESEDTTSGSGSGSDSNPKLPDQNAARDACKDALDLRKKNGEDIDSEQYKSCDSQ